MNSLKKLAMQLFKNNRILQLFRTSTFFFIFIFLFAEAAFPALVITVSSDSVTCFGGSNGRIHVKVISGSGHYVYKLYNGDPLGGGTLIPGTTVPPIGSTTVDTVLYTNLPANANYYVSVFDGTYSIHNIPVYQPAQLLPGVITVLQGLSCSNSFDAKFQANPSGGVPPYTYLWSNGQTTQIATGFGVGIHTVQVRDSKNCGPVTATITFVKALYPAFIPNAISINPNPAAHTDVCGASNNGTITIAATGGTGVVNYSITTGGGSGYQASGSFSSLGAGTYEIWVKDANSCLKQGTNVTIVSVASPVPVAGPAISRCDGIPLAPITMTGASATGTFSVATWSGGAGLGGWTQNANPALATFTPTSDTGSFTSVLTLTGSGVCTGTNPTDIRIISWGRTPTATAGSDISRCDGTPLAPIAMTGASTTGDYSSVTWTGGAGLGTWTQNTNPALATFTPTTITGTFTATLTATGKGACTGTNPTSTRVIFWGQTPTVVAGPMINRCDASPLAPIAMTGTTSNGSFSAATWTGGAGLGTWTQNVNPALATFTPSVSSGTFTATITLTGSSACTGTNPVDTLTISWGMTPTIVAGAAINRCDTTPLAPITMTGATANGSFSTATWTGGAGLGTWIQNANPAMATFTPSVTSGSFTATITLTGSGSCMGTNPGDTRTVTWGQSPIIAAGSALSRCDAAPLAPIAMTGSIANGTYSAATWTGGAGLGTWTQSINPALATFTPTVTSGSFTATITLTGSGSCTGTNPTDTRTITWGQSPSAVPGPDINRCDITPLAPIAMNGASASGTFISAIWSGGAGFGSWIQDANPALGTFTPSLTSGSFTATLTVTGTGSCASSIVTVTRNVKWGQTPTVAAGPPISRCDGIPLAPIVMTGTTANGSFSAATWTGGAGLGTWAQNANPALATFTPSVSSGNFTATLTLTGKDGCTGTNPASTRTITWGQTPTVVAGSAISRCTATPFAPIAMTGATATGTYSAVTWTGGAGLGTWTQNINPALARFTPTVTSGSFIATITLTGSGSCAGTNPTDSRTITWGQSPSAVPGPNINRCDGTPLASIAMTGASASGTFISAIWSGGAGLGSWIQDANPALATYTPSVISGSFIATLTVTGTGSCALSIVTVTRNVKWGQTPIVAAGPPINRCDGTPLAFIIMTGATASGSFSAATWTGGAGLGTWAQNANPALATFTPSVSSGSFTATLTLTGKDGCTGTNPASTRTITWGQTPTVVAGSAISRCTATPFAPIAMTGATATGTYSAATWTGGAGLGTWTQNINPALARFTPTVTSGSFTATITLTGSGSCAGTNPTDSRTITWGQSPSAVPGPNINRCDGTPLASIAMTGASASGTFISAIWSGGAGLGNWIQDANPALATFTPSVISGSFIATLTVTGTGACAASTVIVTRMINWGQIPVPVAGPVINRCDNTPLASVTMTGASATGSFSSLSWSGGAGLGTWTQNANPALATFTPTTSSGTFTAMLTLTGKDGCTGTNPADIRTISWGQTPVVIAGSAISRCDTSPLAPIATTGATATGSFSAITWTGGAGLGTWTQNINPALATFTPTATSGNFTATLTLTGKDGCLGSNPTDTRTITWGQAPVANGGPDISRCDGTPLVPIAMTGSSATGTFSSAAWSGGAGLGSWIQNINPALATFTPILTSGSFTATLTITGTGACASSTITATRVISWGQTPAANAGPDISRCDNTPLADITMTGATATGTFSTVTWTGGSGLGTWTQNVNPALATYTPSINSGSFVDTLTITGTGACASSTATATRNISWGETPVATAGSDIGRCDTTPLAPINMTGSSVAGTYGTVIWSGGAGLGSWSQNLNPSLAFFTPTVNIGSFTATLTVIGTAACASDSATATRIFSWAVSPQVNAGHDSTICNGSVFPINTATAKDYLTLQWTTSGDGTFDNPFVINPLYTPGPGDQASDSVKLYLEATGPGPCTNVKDSMVLTIPQELKASVGAPAPFIIGPTTKITVCLSTAGHLIVQDLGFYLVAPDGTTTVELKKSPMDYNFFGICNLDPNGNVDHLCFTNQLTSADSLPVCGMPTPLTGTYGATGSWTVLNGFNPAKGGWAVIVRDYANNMGGIDGAITNATITFTDVNLTGDTVSVGFSSGVVSIPIDEPLMTTYQATAYQVPLALFTTCFNTCDAQAIVNVVGGKPPYSIDWSDPKIPDQANVSLCPGTFSLTVTDAMGCTANASVDVLSPPAIVIDSLFATTAVKCNGDKTAQINIYAHGGNGTIRYSINGGTTFQLTGNYSNLGAGTYSAMVRDANGCHVDTLIVITEPAKFVLKDSLVDLRCNGLYDAEIHIKGSGGTIPYQYSYDGGTNFTFSADTIGLRPGTYTIQAKDLNGCIAIGDTFNLTDPPALLFDSIHLVKHILCHGDSATVLISAHGGTGKLMYSSDGGTSWSIDSLFSKLGPGNYHFAVKDKNDCMATGDSLKLIDPLAVIISKVDSTNITCHGLTNGSITITASGGSTGLQYSINGGTSFLANSGAFTGLSAGNYLVIAGDSLGCNKTWDTVRIIEPAIMGFADITINNISCTGKTDGKIHVLASGGTAPFTYTLRRNGVDLDTITGNASVDFINLVADTTYTVAVNDTNACGEISSMQLTVAEPAKLVFDSVNVQSITCPGATNGTISIYGHGGTPYNPVPPYQYSIDGGASWDTLQFSGLDIGTYYTALRDARGCAVFGDTVSLANPPAIVVDSIRVTDVVGCGGDSTGIIKIYAHGGTGKLQYSIGGSWSDSLLFVGLKAGTYHTSVRDSMGCAQAGPDTVIKQPTPVTAVITKRDTRNGNNGMIKITASGGTGNYNYSINYAGNIQTSAIDSFNNLSPGKYTVTVQDINGCTYSDTVSLSVIPGLPCLITTTDLSCNGSDDGVININITGGTLPIKYSINDGLTFSYSNIFTSLAGGSYKILAIDTTGLSCALDTLLNEPAPILVIPNISDANCKHILPGETDFGAVTLTVSGGNGNFTYVWKDNKDTVIGNTKDITGLSAGDYTVEVTDIKNCKATKDCTISFDSLKTVDITHHSDTSSCYKTILTLNSDATNATEYLWQRIPINDTLSQLSSFDFSATDSTRIRLLSWNTFKCAAADTFKVRLRPIMGIQIPNDTLSIMGGTSQNLPLQIVNSTGVSFAWIPSTDLNNPAIQNPLFTPVNKSQRYYHFIVTATSADGCMETDTAHVAVLWEITVPSGFTPNNDGHNDKWIIEAAYLPSVNVTVEVFNRWGERVFMEKVYKNDWDGTYRGKPLPIGTYYYVITINAGSTKKTISGPLTIVR